MQLFKVVKKLKGNEAGASLIETLMALAILGLVAAIFLSGLATTSRATIIADELSTAESLARSEMEYVKNYAYQYDATEYPVDPELPIPETWAMSPPVVELVHATDDGIQKVTITVERSGEVILSTEIFKVDR